jgi:phosphatidylserine/phosphatidylglycerophosphate/cardiolipin synthase-like enzyme
MLWRFWDAFDGNPRAETPVSLKPSFLVEEMVRMRPMELAKLRREPLRLEEPRPRILRPGDNCWRVEPASRAAALVDACAYYAALDEALRQARRSVIIIGWDFDGHIKLRADDPDCPALGPFLRGLVEARPELEIRILIWSVAVLHAPGDPVELVIGAEWQKHPRLQLRLDRQHPIYAAHHQKIVVIDDNLAFVGGMDLTVERWDTPAHCADDPCRVRPDGTPYTPVHDIQMVVEGEVARAVAEHAWHRWRVATGEELGPCGESESAWPADLAPEFADTRVAIARTAPPWAEEPPIHEVAKLTADAIVAAREAIYIEAQYLSAHSVGNLLAGTLGLSDGPEIVIVLTRSSHGLVEHALMGRNRDRLLRKLKKADRHGRLRVFYPVVPNGETCSEVLVHSKLMIVDDRFLRIGSANLNNRSIGLDTECDLAIEARRADERRAVRALRDRLLGEHLDVKPEEVAAAVQRERSLVRAVDRLNRAEGRGLRGFSAMEEEGPTAPFLGTGILDPREPFEPLRFLRKKKKRAA